MLLYGQARQQKPQQQQQQQRGGGGSGRTSEREGWGGGPIVALEGLTGKTFLHVVAAAAAEGASFVDDGDKYQGVTASVRRRACTHHVHEVIRLQLRVVGPTRWPSEPGHQVPLPPTSLFRTFAQHSKNGYLYVFEIMREHYAPIRRRDVDSRRAGIVGGLLLGAGLTRVWFLCNPFV